MRIKPETKLYLIDLTERVGWTAVQAGLGVVAVEVNDLGYEWAPVIAVGLAFVKGLVAKQLGNPASASTSGVV